MTDDLYERYKEALRLGHVAVLRGSLEEALTAYRAAAVIAPSRALPHTSLGGSLLRLGRLDEALVEYAAAVARAPHDEGALLGQAEALTMAGKRAEAALALDHVSEIQEAADRLPEAADTLRRAIELDETPERARRQRGLRRETRLSAGDQAAEQLLAKALRLRDEPVTAAYPAPRPGPVGATVPAALIPMAHQTKRLDVLEVAGNRRFADDLVRPAAAESEPGAVEAPAVVSDGEAVSPALVEAVATGTHGVAAQEREAETAVEAVIAVAAPELTEAVAAQPEVEAVELEAVAVADEISPAEPVAAEALAAEPEAGAAAEPGLVFAPVGVMDGAIGTAALPGPVGESEHQPTGDELLVAAEAADLAGDEKALRSLLVWTARAYAREGKFEAGLDATHRLLQHAPGDVDAHLVLVELYVARNWNSLAAEKLALLGRLADLDNDEETRQRLCAVASRAFPNDDRLESLCA
jgi:tetratricopeptide (TPR) repeat protein